MNNITNAEMQARVASLSMRLAEEAERLYTVRDLRNEAGLRNSAWRKFKKENKRI